MVSFLSWPYQIQSDYDCDCMLMISVVFFFHYFFVWRRPSMELTSITNALSPVTCVSVDAFWPASYRSWRCSAPLSSVVTTCTTCASTAVSRSATRTCPFTCRQLSGMQTLQFHRSTSSNTITEWWSFLLFFQWCFSNHDSLQNTYLLKTLINNQFIIWR